MAAVGVGGAERAERMLRDEIPRTGQWFFRHRSFLPLVLLPPFVLEVYRTRERLAGVPQLDRWWAVGCMALALAGLLVRFLTVGYSAPASSGRNTKDQVAGALNTTAFYSLSRNALYFGNFIVTLAALAATRSWELTCVTLLAFFLYYERIVFAEEQFLEQKFGDEYRAWASATPWFWPRLRGWKSPARSFSWRKAIRGEFYTLFGITATLSVTEHARAFARLQRFELDRFWGIVFVVGAGAFVVCRTLKKRTRVLSV